MAGSTYASRAENRARREVGEPDLAQSAASTATAMATSMLSEFHKAIKKAFEDALSSADAEEIFGESNEDWSLYTRMQPPGTEVDEMLPAPSRSQGYFYSYRAGGNAGSSGSPRQSDRVAATLAVHPEGGVQLTAVIVENEEFNMASTETRLELLTDYPAEAAEKIMNFLEDHIEQKFSAANSYPAQGW